MFCVKNSLFFHCFSIQIIEKQGGWSIKKAYLDKKRPLLRKLSPEIIKGGGNL